MSDILSKAASPNLVNITDKALDEVRLLLEKEAPSGDAGEYGLRLGIQGGGCSGLSYKLNFDKRKDNDYVQEFGGIKVFIDPKSAIYMKGITLDYQGGLEGKGFVFINPNATSTCGCGESFSV